MNKKKKLPNPSAWSLMFLVPPLLYKGIPRKKWEEDRKGKLGKEIKIALKLLPESLNSICLYIKKSISTDQSKNYKKGT